MNQRKAKRGRVKRDNRKENKRREAMLKKVNRKNRKQKKNKNDYKINMFNLK